MACLFFPAKVLERLQHGLSELFSESVWIECKQGTVKSMNAGPHGLLIAVWNLQYITLINIRAQADGNHEEGSKQNHGEDDIQYVQFLLLISFSQHGTKCN